MKKRSKNHLEKNKTAIAIAKRVLGKRLEPNNDCAQISALSQKYDSPKEVQIFEILACEQCALKKIGIKAENTIPPTIEKYEHIVRAKRIFKSCDHLRKNGRSFSTFDSRIFLGNLTTIWDA